MDPFTPGIVTYGDPQCPPILFLHGVRLGGRIWHEHALALCNEFFVLTPDLPGHGALAHLPFQAPVIDAFLARLAVVIAKRPPVVVGYSLGGYVAMRYALDVPAQTAGLFLTGCSADIVGYRRVAFELAARVTGLLPSTAMDLMLRAFFTLTLPPDIAARVIPFRFDHRVFEAGTKIACREIYSARLSEYDKPIAIVNGEWDVFFRADETRFARAAHAQIHILPKATHIAPLSRISEFTALVRDFARSVFNS